MRTLNLAVAVTLALSLAACAEDVDDPIAQAPTPPTHTPVEYTHSDTDTPAVPAAEGRLAARSATPSFEEEVLQKPSIPQPAR